MLAPWMALEKSEGVVQKLSLSGYAVIDKIDSAMTATQPHRCCLRLNHACL